MQATFNDRKWVGSALPPSPRSIDHLGQRTRARCSKRSSILPAADASGGCAQGLSSRFDRSAPFPRLARLRTDRDDPLPPRIGCAGTGKPRSRPGCRGCRRYARIDVWFRGAHGRHPGPRRRPITQASMRILYRWLRHMFANSGYAGPKCEGKLTLNGHYDSFVICSRVRV